MFTEIAYAKINLALHVRARRADGYHDIETLFAFVDDGDVLSVELAGADADVDRLTIVGDFAEGLSVEADNLVLRALALARALGFAVPPLAIALDKVLPVAAGLGGGSADAGAMLRLILHHWPLAGTDLAALASASVALGADVPACVLSATAVGTGTGAAIQQVGDSDVTGTPILLVNPGVPVATATVFKGWGGVDRGALPGGSASAITRAGRNDLQAAAVALCPEIDDVLTILRAQLPWAVRMSGSGATCYALFESNAALRAAAERIWADHPDWWLLAGQLR